ncbi:YitT family protein [Metabacillus litoralis]|uniref:YczE/YyaS/YitT family protein n=1 Tax=Metabacillus TaxID=2675233 RepID=UPI001BA2A7D2|nr:YitT family protein [Metabacillus litoralis]MCM3161893.1 YitT family protein [Metabacillus litoralis]MCM3413074.1 YitT family protein [Metabacillus litoralis]UHA62381.1 YitT family protein [Metabacillus litoralis]
MKSYKRNTLELLLKWSIFFIGLFIMSFGIVLTIKADLGVSAWDVLHIGLYKQFGLSIGSWTIMIGGLVLFSASLLTRKLPQVGAFINMFTIGIFIDLFLYIPVLKTPEFFLGKMMMLLMGIIILCYGMGLYISAKCGAGPRDSLMIALVKKTGKSITFIRAWIEVIVLFIGWLLGGPVFIGTVIATISLGYVAGVMIPFCQNTTNLLFVKLLNKNQFQTSLLDRGM